MREVDRRTGAALAAGAAGVALLVAANPFAQPGRCRVADAEPGVAVQVAGSPGLTPPRWAEVCTGDTCRTVDLQRGRSFAALALPDEGRVPLRVAVRDDAGTLVAEQRLVARAVPFSPNGVECSPTVGTVTLALAADGGVRQVGLPRR